jgi:hypothetical protein
MSESEQIALLKQQLADQENSFKEFISESTRTFLKQLDDRKKSRFFEQAYCAAIASGSGNVHEVTENVSLAIKYAQESVRQVGELNKPKCKHEKGWEGPEGGPVYCILCDEKRELADIEPYVNSDEEQARDS